MVYFSMGLHVEWVECYKCSSTDVRERLFLIKFEEKDRKKPSQSRIPIIGCGGLGYTIATNLVKGGVGRIRVVDNEKGEGRDLQRQILYEYDVTTLL